MKRVKETYFCIQYSLEGEFEVRERYCNCKVSEGIYKAHKLTGNDFDTHEQAQAKLDLLLNQEAMEAKYGEIGKYSACLVCDYFMGYKNKKWEGIIRHSGRYMSVFLIQILANVYELEERARLLEECIRLEVKL